MSGPPPPYTWRAGSGYIPPPYANNPPVVNDLPAGYAQVPAPLPLHPMYVNNNHQYFYPPPPPPFLQIPAQASVQAPAPAPPAAPNQQKKEKKKASPPPPPPAPASTIVSAASTQVSNAASTSSSTTICPGSNPNAPPRVRSGTNYMYPPEHTKLHIFNRASKLWADKYAGQNFNFKIFTVSTGFSPLMVIENTLNKRGAEQCKGWAVTEVFEKGVGKWAKGTTVAYTDDRAKASLASMGWTAKRGGSLPPVWLVVHKV